MNESLRPVALITGSGRRRVGYVIARFLAEKNYRIALHYNSSVEEACQTRDELRELGTECDVWQADVADENEVETMIRGVVDRFGRLDVLVTTASIWSTTPFEQITADDLRKNFDVNTLGTFFAARSAGRVMVNQPEGGAIVTIGDWAIERPYLDHAPYFVSKGSIPTLTRVLALELGHRNPRVRVNCIHPGPVMFPPGTPESEQQQLIDSTLLKTADCPDMVAQAVDFFITNTFVTGTCLPVDGGRHMYTPSDATRK
ncbi:MAG: SDR family oxidoreductase [Fuerstiella sp.]